MPAPRGSSPAGTAGTAGHARRPFEYLGDELRVARDGASLRDRLRVLRLMAYMRTRVGRARPLTRNLPERRPREFDLRLGSGPYLRLRTTDWVLVEIFSGAYEVDLSPLGDVKEILDLGANVGLASIYLAGRLPDARFTCVEPSPDNFRLLRENLRRNLPEARAVNAAVVAKGGAYSLEESTIPAEGRVVPGTGREGVPVQALTIPDILAAVGLDSVDLLKVDIEGGEVDLFAAADAWSDRVGALIAEVHEPLTVAEAESRLAEHGFKPLPRPHTSRFANILYMARSGPGRRAGATG